MTASKDFKLTGFKYRIVVECLMHILSVLGKCIEAIHSSARANHDGR
jgi:hypothetical protein